MTHFLHAELLLGGARLRELEGDIDKLPVDHEEASECDEAWSGQFRIENDQLNSVEIGRPYLLILDDGRDRQVKVTEVTRENDEQYSLIRFRSARRPR